MKFTLRKDLSCVISSSLFATNFTGPSKAVGNDESNKKQLVSEMGKGWKGLQKTGAVSQ